MRYCIIGKNSRIVSQLRLGKDIHLFSCSEIENVPWAEYELIWLFSWFYNDIQKNIEIINSIPSEKLIFISTQSVAANKIAKQPFKYINDKLKCEDLVLSKGGKVCRIASVDLEKIKDCGEIVAYTCLRKLEKFILSSDCNSLKPITEFYDLVDGNKKVTQ